MSKATTPKTNTTKPVEKVETKVEEPQVTEVAPEIKEEDVAAPTPTPTQVVEAKKEQPVASPVVVKEEKSHEERIIEFVESRKEGEIRLNDFLKSLFPMPTMGNPAEYLQQGTSKMIKGLLSKMKEDGKLSFKDDNYLQLGKGYYKGAEQVLAHRDITNTEIIVQK